MRSEFGKVKLFKCEDCGKPFTDVAVLEKHSRIVHSKESNIQSKFKPIVVKEFNCQYCHKVFANKSHLSQHEVIHTKDKPFHCIDCGETFSDKSKLIIHSLQHRRIKYFRCAGCGKAFKNRAALLSHQLTHCGKNVASENHVLNKTINGTRSSKPCSPAASNSKLLSIGSGKTQFKCQDCGKTFKHISTLEIHSLLHGRGKQSKSEKLLRSRKTDNSVKKPSTQFKFDIVKSNNTTNTPNTKKEAVTEKREQAFKCTVCGITCKFINQFKSHLLIHRDYPQDCENSKIRDEYDSDECLDCSITSGPCKLHFEEHLVDTRKANDDRPFKCQECGKRFKRKAHLTRHGLTHGKEKTPSCGPSNKVLSKMVISKKPELSHDERFKCHLCSKSFKESWGLKYHMVVHTSEKPFKCTHCKCAYKRNPDLRKHMLRHNGEIASKSKICDQVVKQRSHFKGRMVRDVKNLFKCDYCNKTFMLKSLLTTHTSVHHPEKSGIYPEYWKKYAIKKDLKTSSFECASCGKTFKTRRYLASHTVSHYKDKPFKCEKCSTAFRRKSNLLGHEAIHRQEKPFTCDKCGKTFKRMSYLRKHFKRPHDATQTSYVRSVSSVLHPILDQHIKYDGEQALTSADVKVVDSVVNHHEGNPFQRLACCKAYKTKKLLREHIVLLHSGEVPHI